MKRLILILLILLVNFRVTAFQLKAVRGVVIDDNKNAVKNFTLRFSTIGDVVTTQTGEFIIEIPSNLTYLELSVSDTSWSILYPLDLKIPIPSDPNFVTKIVLKRSSKNNDQKLGNIVKEYSKLKILLAEIGIKQDELTNLFEDFIKMESSKANLNSENLRSAIQKSIKREEIFPEVSSMLSDYNLKIQNLNSYFQNVSDLAFVDTMANRELVNAIIDYNDVFRKLNNNKNSLENSFNLYWNSSIKEKFSDLVDYILDEIHIPYILKLNQISVGMNELVRGYISGKDKIKERTAELKNGIHQITNELNIRLPILQRKTNEIIAKLQAEGFE